MRVLIEDQIVYLSNINTGQFDERYLLNSEIPGLDSIFVTSGEFNNLDLRYVQFTGNNQRINLNNGLTVSGSPLIVASSGIFESGLSIEGDLILNGKKVIVQAEATPFATEGI
jgi:hypothetical protein